MPTEHLQNPTSQKPRAVHYKGGSRSREQRHRFAHLGLVAVMLGALAGCDGNQADTYTLYRTSTLAPMRVHVATFDAEGEPESYNRGNCEMVVKYLAQQPEVPDGYYWCEPGRFRG
jgi:hypothetical protein